MSEITTESKPVENQKKGKPNDTVVTMRQLLETGVHFGHQTKRWNPKMKPFIYTSRNDIHVIDLQKTLRYINQAYDFVKEEVSKGANVLFVGTKKQAQSAIEEEAKRCEMPYVCNRWLGGMLTNFETIKKSINKMKEIEEWKVNGIFDALGSKEQSTLNKRLTKLGYHLNGMRELNAPTNIVFIVDTKKEEIAVHEANILKLAIIGVVDTNCDPDLISHPIPANDDAIRTIKLLANIIANAVIEGKKLRPSSKAESITDELEKKMVIPSEEASIVSETEDKFEDIIDDMLDDVIDEDIDDVIDKKVLKKVSPPKKITKEFEDIFDVEEK